MAETNENVVNDSVSSFYTFDEAVTLARLGLLSLGVKSVSTREESTEGYAIFDLPYCGIKGNESYGHISISSSDGGLILHYERELHTDLIELFRDSSGLVKRLDRLLSLIATKFSLETLSPRFGLVVRMDRFFEELRERHKFDRSIRFIGASDINITHYFHKYEKVWNNNIVL